MTETINAFHVAPTGYARTYASVSEHGCEVHPNYRPLCSGCGFKWEDKRVALDDDIVALILDPQDGSVVEWITDTAYGPDIAHLAHQGEVVIREDFDADNSAIIALAAEARLVADCFGVQLSDKWPSA